MSVRHSLLALLSAGAMHGYGLKTEFEAATVDVWPLNVGQVYTTLGRLERDGLVTAEADAEGQKVYEITEAGRDELRRWFDTPVQREVIPRQELAIKLVFAMRSGLADVAAVVQRQRVATVRALQDVTRLKAEAEAGRGHRPGCSCSTHWSSRPRPRRAGSTCARCGSRAMTWPRARPAGHPRLRQNNRRNGAAKWYSST